MHTGTAEPQDTQPETYRNEMCPAGIATAHPTGSILNEWSKMGVPDTNGKTMD